jgi:hypothetical protein
MELDYLRLQRACHQALFIGIGKHDKNMYLPCVGWIALDSAVIAGVVSYG